MGALQKSGPNTHILPTCRPPCRRLLRARGYLLQRHGLSHSRCFHHLDEERGTARRGVSISYLLRLRRVATTQAPAKRPRRIVPGHAVEVTSPDADGMSQLRRAPAQVGLPAVSRRQTGCARKRNESLPGAKDGGARPVRRSVREPLGFAPAALLRGGRR